MGRGVVRAGVRGYKAYENEYCVTLIGGRVGFVSRVVLLNKEVVEGW